MRVIIQQTRSDGKNLFQVISNGQILFQAKTPWFNLNMPFNLEKKRELVFTDPAGETLYTTRYNVIENMVEEFIPMKYLVTKEQKFGQFELIGKNGEEGKFYTVQNALLDEKFCIKYGERMFLGYVRDTGRNSFVSIYEDDTQIAQITKPHTVTDNLDVYYLHIKDEYSFLLPVLSFFVVFFDYSRYNHSGELRMGTQYDIKYSYDKNIDKYNPNWIAEEFGRQEAEEFEEIIKGTNEVDSADLKKLLKIMGLCFLIFGLAAVAFILFVVLNSPLV